MYDPKTKVWSQGRAMQCRRSAVGVAALDDKVHYYFSSSNFFENNNKNYSK